MNEPISRRNFIKVSGAVAASACTAGLISFLAPERADAWVAPVFAVPAVGNVIVTLMAALYGLTLSSTAMTDAELIAKAAEDFTTWAGTVTIDVAETLTTFFNEAVSAGRVLISSITSEVWAGLQSFAEWIRTSLTPSDTITIGSSTLEYQTWSLTDINKKFNNFFPDNIKVSSWYAVPEYAVQRIYTVGGLSRQSTVTFGEYTWSDRVVIPIAVESSNGVPTTVQSWESFMDMQIPGFEYADDTVFDFEALSGVKLTSDDRYYGDLAALSNDDYFGPVTVIAPSSGTRLMSATPPIIFADNAVLIVYENKRNLNSLIGVYDVLTKTVIAGKSDLGLGIEQGLDGWTVVDGYPSDVVISPDRLLGNDLVIGDDGTITDQGSIAIPEGIPVTWGDAIYYPGIGVVTGDISSGITTGSNAIAGTTTGTISGTVGELVGETTATGSSTTDNSLSATFPWSDIVFPSIPRVFPFSLPWDLYDFLNALTPSPSFPDSFTLPFNLSSWGGNHDLVLDTSWLKSLRSYLTWPIRILWTGVVLKIALMWTHREG